MVEDEFIFGYKRECIRLMFIGEESYNLVRQQQPLLYHIQYQWRSSQVVPIVVIRIEYGTVKGSTDNTEQKNCDAVNGIVEIKGTYTSAITPAYLLVAFTSGAKRPGKRTFKNDRYYCGWYDVF